MLRIANVGSSEASLGASGAPDASGEPSARGNVLGGRVQQILFRGSKCEVVVEAPNGSVLRSMIDLGQASRLAVGAAVALEFAPDETFMFWAGE
jgi:hypothetical protein